MADVFLIIFSVVDPTSFENATNKVLFCNNNSVVSRFE